MKVQITGKLTVLMLAALAAAFVSFGCSTSAGGQDSASGQNRGGGGGRPAQGGRQTLGDRGGMREAVPVEVISPWRANLASYVYGKAHIEANRVVEVVARVDGLLENLHVEEGSLVRAGQVLARLDRDQLQLALDEARAQLENAQSIYERNLKMLEKELTSREVVDNSKYQFDTARTRHERAELNLQYATITAPFSGIITRRNVEVGDLVRTNTVLFSIADMNKLLARVYIPEKEMARVNVGDLAQVESEMIPGNRFQGAVEMISPVVDPTTGTIKVTVHVNQGGDLLKPGMFCSVFILTETHEDVMVISRKTLLPDTERPEVFVIDDSSRAQRRPLEIGIQQGDTLEVISGLKPDERVVLIGQENLREGTAVLLSTGTEARDSAFRRLEAAPAE